MEKLKSNKWVSLISGVLVILAGIFYLVEPLQAAISLGLFIGILLIVKGITAIFSYRSNHENVQGAVLAGSILDIIMGLLLVTHVFAAALSIPYIIGFWTMFTGILEIVKSFSLKKIGFKKWLLVLVTGIFNIIIAYFIMSNVLASVVAITMLLGIYFIVYGITFVVNFLVMNKD